MSESAEKEDDAMQVTCETLAISRGIALCILLEACNYMVYVGVCFLYSEDCMSKIWCSSASLWINVWSCSKIGIKGEIFG